MYFIRQAPSYLAKSAKSTRVYLSSNAANSSSFNGIIPPEAVEKRFSLSSGPGGQNVQKNATKAEIRFNLRAANWLPDHLKDPLERRFFNRINSGGEVVIQSDRTRERNLNLADCFDKLRSTIYEVEKQLERRQETEEDTIIIRKKAEKAAEYRLAEKRRLSEKRRQRSQVDFS